MQETWVVVHTEGGYRGELCMNVCFENWVSFSFNELNENLLKALMLYHKSAQFTNTGCLLIETTPLYYNYSPPMLLPLGTTSLDLLNCASAYFVFWNPFSGLESKSGKAEKYMIRLLVHTNVVWTCLRFADISWNNHDQPWIWLERSSYIRTYIHTA